MVSWICGHGAYYRCVQMSDENQDEEQEGQPGLAERPRQRPLREARAKRGLSRACRLQAQGDRRDAGPDQAGPPGGGPRLGARRLEPVLRRKLSPGGAAAASSTAPSSRWTSCRWSRSRASRSSRAISASRRCWRGWRQSWRAQGRHRGVGHGAQPVGHRVGGRRAHYPSGRTGGRISPAIT